MALASRSAPARRLLSRCSYSYSSSTSLANIGILSWRRPTMRRFHGMSAHQMDGASIDLTDKDFRTPWAEVEALIEGQQDKAEALRSSRKPEERDMSPKKSSDSYHRVVLPLGRDPSLRETYVNALGGLKLGTILTDLDNLSGVIVSKHAGPGITPVTVGSHHLATPHLLTEVCDLEYTGQVTSVLGNKFIAITCKVARAGPDGEQPSNKPEDVLLTCTFTVQALDPETKRPVRVPPLIDEMMPQEVRTFRAREAMALLTKKKKKAPKKSLLSETTDPDDSGLIHKVWMRKVAQAPYRRSGHAQNKNENKNTFNEPFEEISLHEPDEEVPVAYLKTTRPRKVELVNFRTDEVVDGFVSQTECAKFLDISETAVRKRLKNNTVFEFKNSLLYLR
ncbi:hypothetical protein F5Y07DRAFT_384991 [Xylaria sp. FL0933]|nr:hypothetical protein F5Y07DRAFT_384991 [Xylaria sp. FL0933]